MRRKTIFHPVYGRVIDKLKHARKAQGMTQLSAGQGVGMSRNWVHKVEQREIRVDVLQLVRLCRVYGVASAEVMRQIEDELPEEGEGSLLIFCARVFSFLRFPFFHHLVEAIHIFSLVSLVASLSGGRLQ